MIPLLVTLWLLLLPALSWAQAAEELYQKLQGLNPEKRHPLLVEGAKREGTLTVYATTSGPAIENLFNAFRKSEVVRV